MLQVLCVCGNCVVQLLCKLVVPSVAAPGALAYDADRGRAYIGFDHDRVPPDVEGVMTKRDVDQVLPEVVTTLGQ